MSLGLHTLLGCHLGALDVERGKEGCIEMACALLEGVPCSGCTWARAEPFGPEIGLYRYCAVGFLLTKGMLLDLPEPVQCCMVASRTCL